MKPASTIIALALLCAFPLNMLAHWGTRWQLGRYGMPRPLIVDGRFADGSPTDELTLATADWHEELALGFACVLVAGLAHLVRVNRRIAREDAAVAGVLKDVPVWWLEKNGIRKVNGRYLREQRDD